MDIMDRFIRGLAKADPQAVHAMAINSMVRELVYSYAGNPYQRDSFAWGDKPRYTRMSNGQAVY